MLKRLFSIITISLVLTGSFFSAYNIKYPVYADDTTDGWTQVTTNQQLVDAFKAYCKSRDITIDGSIADGVTKFTTSTFNGLCNTLGIDVTALQAQLKYKTDGNLGTRFLFTTTGIDAYNRIFAQFLQDNDLEVGDENVNKTVYSGRYFRDDDGNTCLCYIINMSNNYVRSNDLNPIQAYGTTLKYSESDIVSSVPLNGSHNFSFNIFGNVYNTPNKGFTINCSRYYLYTQWGYKGSTETDIYCVDDVYDGYFCKNPSLGTSGHYTVVYSPTNDTYYVGIMGFGIGRERHAISGCFAFKGQEIVLNDNTVDNCNISIVSTVINNNVYEGDTIINNNGTTGDDDENPDNPDIPDPNPNPTPDPPTIPDSGGWQDFSLPEMPNDWLIYGMEKKFPFDIPFNILFALSLLNHEPEIPKFEGDIDLQVCTWHYDIDLTPFDDIATILRKFEVLGFIIGLAILTKNLINWG